jgi:hypothetical protein
VRAIFGLVGLLVVLAIVGINVRNELHAQKALLVAPAGAAGASAPFGGTSSPSVAQFQQELNKAMRGSADAAAARASEADESR